MKLSLCLNANKLLIQNNTTGTALTNYKNANILSLITQKSISKMPKATPKSWSKKILRKNIKIKFLK